MKRRDGSPFHLAPEREKLMREEFSRTARIFGVDAIDILARSRVAIFGVGGVGGYVVEALARSGVGTLDLIDCDKVSLSNINRQIIALHSTVGKYKVQVMKERVLDINPEAVVHAHQCFFLPETKDEFDFSQYSYVVDAVDTVAAKIQLVMQAQEAGVPIISSMGAGNKVNPQMFEVADIYSTSIDPLARVMRRELKKRGVKSLKVVYSKEPPIRPTELENAAGSTATVDASQDFVRRDALRRAVPGSCAFVPSAAGLIIAGEVVKDLVSGTVNKL